MTAMHSRRRFIAICAAAAGAALPLPGAAGADIARWRGAALGARASLAIAGMARGRAEALIAAARAEIARMDALFSLFRADSALSRLNAAGELAPPPPEMLEILSLCGAVHAATGGAFDPTVQPAVAALLAGGRSDAPVGWRHVRLSAGRVALARPGMALTLNGIAQGHATDRVAALLRASGAENVLVSVGEVAALGRPAPDRRWRVGLAAREDGAAEETVALEDMALATTAPLTALPGGGAAPHLFDPRTGAPAPARWRRLSVIHPRAAVADGLSTGCAMLEAGGVRAALAAFPGARAIAVGADGARLEI